MIQNVNERISAVHVGIPWRGLFPVPDGALGANDRGHVATFYGARLTPLITNTTILQHPVDCVLAGQQQTFRKGRAMGRALKHTFGE